MPTSKPGAPIKSEPAPEVPTVFVLQEGDTYVFRCGYCTRNHYHGAGCLGHRVAHCDHGGASPYLATGYNLALDPDPGE